MQIIEPPTLPIRTAHRWGSFLIISKLTNQMVATHTTNWTANEAPINLSDETVNLIVDAYRKGKVDGYKDAVTSEAKMLAKSFSDNLKNAMTVSEQLLKAIEQHLNINVTDLFMRIDSVSNFKTAIIVPYEFYVSDKRRELTELLLNKELETETDTFELTFTVIPNKESLDKDKLQSDGFIFEYAN